MAGTGSGGRFVMIALNTTHFLSTRPVSTFTSVCYLFFHLSYPFGLWAVVYPGSAYQAFGEIRVLRRFTNIVFIS